MVEGRLTGAKVAFLATNGYEDSELTAPWKAVVAEGGKAVLISPHSGTINGKHGHQARVDLPVDVARASLFDALILPGGRANADHVRQDEYAIGFVRDFFDAGKPVGAICRGSWILIPAHAAKGRTLTSHPDLAEEFQHAGAHWVDRQVVIDGNLFTSRNPADLTAFIAALMKELQETTGGA